MGLFRGAGAGLLIAAACAACNGGTPSGTGTTEPGGPDVTALDEKTFARLVVAMGSCNGDDGPLRITTYLRGRQDGYAYPHVSTSCLTTVTTGCDGILACYGLVPPPPGAALGTCVGNVAVIDFGGWDCSKVGATCEAGECVPPGGRSCDASLVASCDAEGRPIDCQHLVQTGPACGAFGLVCNAASPSEAFCEGSGAACAMPPGGFDYFDVAPHGTACNDPNTLTACVRGKTADLDCALLGDGFTCQTSGAAFFCGLRGDCDPATFGTQCEGTTAVFCDAGRLERVDCASFGLTTCSTSGSMCR